MSRSRRDDLARQAAIEAGRRYAIEARRSHSITNVHEREVRLPDGTWLIERFTTIEEVRY